MVDAVGTGALLAADSGPELPTVNDFLPPEILFQGTPFAINRIILIRIVATVVLLVVLGITAKRAKLIPGRWQGVVEMGIDFVRDSVVYQVMGELRGKRYVPMISTLFFTIFVFNLCGIIPGMNMAATATVVMPLVFAVWVLIQYWITAAREKGLWGYIRDECFPQGGAVAGVHPAGADPAVRAGADPPGIADHPSVRQHDLRALARGILPGVCAVLGHRRDQ